MNTEESKSEILRFESGHFLHSLFGNDDRLLKDISSYFGVKVTSRDGWIKFSGDEKGVDESRSLFHGLESVRRAGLEITVPVFRMALNAVKDNKNPETLLASVLQHRLLGSRSKPAVVPQSVSQLEYLQLIQENDVVFGSGAAGTGKTFLAMAAGLSALKEGKVRRVVLTRPAVEAGEALGFLPGDFEEKLYPYLRPLYDALYDMLDPEEVEKYIDRGLIEVAPLAYMRGRTLANSFVILDEAQNTTREQMLMFLTRIGMQSKCVITGDPTQIDLRGKNHSGLLEAIRLLSKVKSIGFVNFKGIDVVRHPVVRRIIEAYEKGREV